MGCKGRFYVGLYGMIQNVLVEKGMYLWQKDNNMHTRYQHLQKPRSPFHTK